MARPAIKTLVNMDDATARREISRAVSTLAGGWWEFDIKPRKSTRSIAQNAWYWSCIAGALAKYMSAQDYEITTAGDAHEFLKDRFLRVDVVNPKTGEVIGSRGRSTTKLTTTEMADFCDRCRVFMDDFFGIPVPDPDPNWRTTAPKEEPQYV